MSHYNFKQDHAIALSTERYIEKLFWSNNRDRIAKIEHNNDNRYDLKITMKNGEVVTVEIKEDFTCANTGNVGVEYSCRGKPSGIQVSKADLYCYRIHEPNGIISVWIIETTKLKALIAGELYFRTVNGGDVGSDSLNYLFKLNVFKKNAQLFHSEVK